MFDYRDKTTYMYKQNLMQEYMDLDIVLFHSPHVRHCVKAMRLMKKLIVNTKEEDKKRCKDYPAVVVQCCVSDDLLKGRRRPLFYFGHSGSKNKIASNPTMKERLDKLRKNKDHSNLSKNPIGNCAEQHAAAELLENHPSCGIEQIVFSSAFRPRTDEMVRYCGNCKIIFNL